MAVNEISIIDSQGKPVNDRTVEAYAYEDAQPLKYDAASSPLYVLANDSAGGYYVEVSSDVKVTIVITDPGGAILVPEKFRGKWFSGENRLNIDPSTLP